jgi:hypothetical protein
MTYALLPNDGRNDALRPSFGSNSGITGPADTLGR